MMVIQSIDGQDPRDYASGPEKISTLTKSWKYFNTEYELELNYHISNDEAKTLFQKNEDLGLCEIELDASWNIFYDDDRTLTFQYDSINDTFEYFSEEDTELSNDAMRILSIL